MTATTVHRRHRKDAKVAKQRRDEQLAALERLVLARLPPDPEPTDRQRVPLKQRPPLPTKAPWMHDPKAEAAWLRSFIANRSKHHASHSPSHAKAFWCSFGRGVAKAVVRSRDYVVMPDRLKVLVDLASSGQKTDHEDMSARYDEIRKLRATMAKAAGGTVGCVLLALLVAWASIWWAVGWVVAVPVAIVFFLAVVAPGFALYGRKPKTARVRPVTAADARATVEPRPSADIVHAAFGHVGLGDITCEVAPHREGPGWETLVRIPPGPKSFADAVKAADALAGNLGITRECLFLDPVRGYGGSTKHVRVWWTKEDPFAGDPPPHPLLDPRALPADLWTNGVPIGIDARGRIAHVAVVDTPAIAVIGQPGAGKTHVSFGIGAAAGADPLWDLDAWSFTQSGSFAPLKPLVEACGGTYGYGSDQRTFTAFGRYLDGLLVEIAARNRILDQLPIDLNPHDRVERAVAIANRRMRPRLILADEIITPIEGDKTILPRLEEVNRVDRRLHFVFVFSAQFADSETLRNLQKLFGARIVLSLARHNDTETAMGGHHVAGLTEPHRIPGTAKGQAYVGGAIEDPEIGPRPAFKIRTFGIDRGQLAEHTKRCLAGPRAGQGARVRLVKDDDPTVSAARAQLREALNGDEVLTLKGCGERLEMGVGAAAAKKAAERAREARVEPLRDTTGKVTGDRMSLYIHRDQLN